MRKKKSLFIKILAVILWAILLVGAISLAIGLVKSLESEKQSSEVSTSGMFKIGYVSSFGVIHEDLPYGLYSDMLLSVEGLNLETVEEADIVYICFLYDEDINYLGNWSFGPDSEEHFNPDILEKHSHLVTAKYMRILILPRGNISGNYIELSEEDIPRLEKQLKIIYKG